MTQSLTPNEQAGTLKLVHYKPVVRLEVSKTTNPLNVGDEAQVRSKREAKLAKYREERDALVAEQKTLKKRRDRVGARLRSVSDAIYDLLHESDEVPSVADHAVVRYLERVKGMDIKALKIEIAHHKQAQRVGNAIVTVNEELE